MYRLCSVALEVVQHGVHDLDLEKKKSVCESVIAIQELSTIKRLL